MNKYPLIEKLGLKIHHSHGNYTSTTHDYVHVEDLESLLASAPVVYGRTSPDVEFFDENGPSATHTARLLCIEPISKAVTEKELQDFVDKEMAGETSLALIRKIIEHGYAPQNGGKE